MSDSAFQDWLVSDSWQDFRQQRAIREIESSLDGQRAESRALRSQLSRLQGSLEQRLSRLIRSFDAFVELSDLRAALAGFDEAARVRYRMRQILAFRAGAVADLPAPPDDVDGYWLAPAAAALAALTRGDDPAADLERAGGRDPRRTALLLVMSGAGADPGSVGQAFGEPLADTQLTAAERAVWLAAADGDLGDPARELVAARLSALVTGLGQERRAELDRSVAERIRGAAVTGLTTSADLAAVGALTAGARLAALREWAAPPAPDAAVPVRRGGGGPAKVAAGTAPVGEDPPAVAAPAVPSRPEALAALEALLPGLVDEGSTEEAATLKRIAELRAVIDDREAAPVTRWDDPAGLPLPLLVSDAFGEAPGPSALARRVLRDRLLAVAESLRAATDVAEPQEQTVTIERQNVRIRAAGPAPADLAELYRVIDARYPAPPSVLWPRFAWFAGAAALLLATASVPMGLGIVLVIGAAILGFVGVRRIFADRLAAGERAARLREARERADKQIERERQTLLALGRRLDDTRRRAPEDLAAIRAALTS